MKITLPLALLAVLMTGCVHSTQNVERIPHLSALRLADSNGVMFESNEPNWKLITKAPGFPSAIKTNGVTQVTLQAGNSFMLTEGHHGWVILKLLRVTDGQIIVEETTFHRPPDKPKTTRTVRRIRVSPYSRESAATAKTLSHEEIYFWVNHINDLKRADVHTLHRALVCDQTYLRAKAAEQLGETGDATSISHLIDALSDESIHDGVVYLAAGMETTRYWANESLKKLTGQDFRFGWDAANADREAAIQRWKKWFSMDAQRLAPLVKPLSHEEIGRLITPISNGEVSDRDTLHRALVSDQTYLRAKAAQQLGETGDATSIPHLIDALSDESFHVGVQYPAAGMETTRYWVNESLKKLTRQDFGFRWDAVKADREAAIQRWKKWFTHRVAPLVKPFSEEEIGRYMDPISTGKISDVEILHRALVSGHYTLRADAAKLLGEVGDATSIAHLIDALSDESMHVGDKLSNPGMATTRYWANDSLKKLTKLDFGFRWNASKTERETAIEKWKQWFSEQEFADLLRLVAKAKQP